MDKSKIFLDLSKCTEGEQKHVISLLPKPKFQNQYEITNNEFLLSFDTDNEWWVYVDEYVEDKTELTYPEFIKLFNYTVQEDMICPVNKNHCDDECCTIGSTCNLSGNLIN